MLKYHRHVILLSCPQYGIRAPTAEQMRQKMLSPPSALEVVLPPAVPDGVVGYWPFDQSSPLDASGNNGHGLPA